MKTLSGIYRGNRTVELSDSPDLPEDTAVFVVIPEQESETDIHRQLRNAAEAVSAKLWNNEEDEVWNEYL